MSNQSIEFIEKLVSIILNSILVNIDTVI